MRKHNSQGTPWKANWIMWWEEMRVFPKGRASHKFLNIWVELIRANPKTTYFVILALTAVILEWLMTGTFL